jgi:hypothetical protein
MPGERELIGSQANRFRRWTEQFAAEAHDFAR